MINHGKRSEAALRFAERRQREDDAPRLSAEIPRLTSLRLEIHERRRDSLVAEPLHVRRIVVERAPALFVLPCGDPRCTDSNHDVTHAILSGLRAGESRFEGEDVCYGSLGSGQCTRILHFVVEAAYGTPA